jgi:CubicO group peptidase (beta-lactamase class C family)
MEVLRQLEDGLADRYRIDREIGAGCLSDSRLRAAASRVALYAAILAASAAPVNAQGPPAGWQEFRSLFRQYVESDGVVGASAVVMRDGRVLDRYDIGHADRAAGVPVGEPTLYHWGSITKSLTAIAIMQLRDRGELDLDHNVTRYLPELRQVHDPFGMMDSITIRMLLSHTAGFMNSTWPYDEGLPWAPFEPTHWSQLTAMMPYQQLLFRPGSRYGYSNPAFIYLARIIEQLTGDPWDAYVQKNIFAPLGLTHSYFRRTPYHLAAHRSHNYYIRADSAGVARLSDNGPDFDPGITTPNGGWNAPVGDLARYTAYLTNTVPPDGSRQHYETVLKRSSLQEMWQPVAPMAAGYGAGADNFMGLSFFLIRRGDQQLAGHTGSQAGFRSFFYFNPATSVAVIVALNTTNYANPDNAAFQRMHTAARDLLW